jgi:hypothetical protein
MGQMRMRVEQVLLVSGMTLATLNLWTGVPFAALWIGSRAVTDGQISMLAVFVVAVSMFALGYVVVRGLSWMDFRWRALTGRDRVVRQHTPWLRSMSGERPHHPTDGGSPLQAIDYVLVAVVVACMVTFEIWFFFFSGSSIDQRSGRS